MKHQLRSAITTVGRRMAGARSLWRANGMTKEQMGMPVIGIANSFTQMVPGHVHLHEIGLYDILEDVELTKRYIRTRKLAFIHLSFDDPVHQSRHILL